MCLTLRPFSPEALIGMVFAVDRAGRLSEGLRGPYLLCGGFATSSSDVWFLRLFVQVALRRGQSREEESVATIAACG